MTRDRTFRRFVIAAVAVVGGLGISLVGCANSQQAADDGNTKAPAATTTASSEKGASQLWSENCAHCHNVREPSSFSDAQWSIIVHHMRLQADLTGREQREITKLMQAANN